MKHRGALSRRYGHGAGSILPPGTPVRVKSTHGYAPFRGDTGVVDHYVPFGKYYVELREHGRQFVDGDDLERRG